MINKQESRRAEIPDALPAEKYTYNLGAAQAEVRHIGTKLTSSDASSKHTSISAKDLGYAVLRTAIQRANFTYSYLLEQYSELPTNSMRAYIKEVLFNPRRPLKIRLEGRSLSEAKKLSQQEKLEIAEYFVHAVKDVIDKKAMQMSGTSFSECKPIKKVFKDTTIVSEKTATCYAGAHQAHHAYETLYLTGEEIRFLGFLDGYIDELKKKYEETYILRNERFFKIYNFKDGKAFEPDFVLFAKEEGKPPLVVQCFIEPKGYHIQSSERWKEDFLEEIGKRSDVQQLSFSWGRVRLVGLPFYSESQETDFKEAFEKAFKLDDE